MEMNLEHFYESDLWKSWGKIQSPIHLQNDIIRKKQRAQTKQLKYYITNDMKYVNVSQQKKLFGIIIPSHYSDYIPSAIAVSS